MTEERRLDMAYISVATLFIDCIKRAISEMGNDMKEYLQNHEPLIDVDPHGSNNDRSNLLGYDFVVHQIEAAHGTKSLRVSESSCATYFNLLIVFAFDYNDYQKILF